MGKKSKHKKGNKSVAVIEDAEGQVVSRNGQEKLSKKEYEAELFRLQVELVKLQDWVKHTKARIVIVFEGRDAAGKGGIIKRILER